MDQAEFDAIMARAKSSSGPVAGAENQTGPAPEAANVPTADDASGAQPSAEQSPPIDPNTQRPDGSLYSDPPPEEPGLGDASGLDAIAGGALKSVFETRDLLFGEPIEDDKSEFRQNVEKTVELRKEQSALDGFSAGVAQFATAMVGLGKFSKPVQMIAPWFGKGLALLPKTAEVAKAATAGAVAFDPYEERLSNLVQGTWLANPVTEWLAASPDDSPLEGRVKSAMESIGMDVAFIGAFLGATKTWKYLRMGDQQKAAAEVAKMEQEAQNVRDREAIEAAQDQAGGPPTGTPELPDGGPSGDASRQPSAGPNGTPGDPDRPTGPAVDGVGGSPQQPKIVANPTEAADLANTTLNSPQPRVQLRDEDTVALLDSMESDSFALEQFGGWQEAIDGGHTFGKGEGIPWGKLNTDSDTAMFAARLVDVMEEKLDTLKGGAVLHDKRVDKTAERMTRLFNVAPAEVLGMINRAGKDANNMVATMEAGYLVANRMLLDVRALAGRIQLGDPATLLEYGGRDGALNELKRRASIATSVYGSAKGMTAAAGRAVRRMRLDFTVDPEKVKAMQTMDSEHLLRTLTLTNDAKDVAKVLDTSLWSKATDLMDYLLINNLVSGPTTQVINLTTNAYMVVGRPMERIFGAAIQAARGTPGQGRIFKESLKQYSYLGNAFTDGFSSALRAFLANDSRLAPHATTEAYKGNQALARAVGPWRSWDSVGGVMSNAFKAALMPIGLPTRILGTVDEMVKQTTYRSVVMSRAHVQAAEDAAAAGLTGKAFKRYIRDTVKDAVDKAFDSEGRGLDADALREAHITSFQQNLLPGTIGRTIQSGVNAHPGLRFVLPFVKTPTNVIRYGWKMTPFLNLAQKEYREMLNGAHGLQAQAQATGQFTMGGLFMGTAAYMVSQGTITGGGPSDYKAKQELLATGWRPYSVVVQNEDGTKTYLSYGRFDPVAIPFGIIADLMDWKHNTDHEEDQAWDGIAGGLMIALAKQFTSKTYLQGVAQLMDTMRDPEGRAEVYAGQLGANLIPFSAGLRQVNQDPYLRDTREMLDKAMATVPGLSSSLPPRRNWLGDPVLSRNGLWSTDEDQMVDREIQRMTVETGSGPVRPSPRVANGVDLRDITMEDGSNAYDTYQRLAGHPSKGPSLKTMVAKLMQSEAYQTAPDGEAGIKGSRMWLITGLTSKYREKALKALKADKNVQDALMAEEIKVRAAYAKNKGLVPPPRDKRPPIEKLGDAFGVDLGAPQQ